jgi:curved DNA-binding protein CbpA
MNIYMSMNDGINMTNASSGKILAKQYHPDIGGKDNPTGYIYWKLNIKERSFSF